MKDPPTRKTKKPHGTPSKGDSQPPHGELRPTFYNPFEVKHRQRISKSQYKILEKVFTDNPMPNGDTRQQLATQLSMTPRTIQVWFQNRRAKNKVSMGNPDPGAKGDTPSSSGDIPVMEAADSEIEYTDHHENDTPMFIQELFSRGSEPDLDENALNIDMRSDITLSPEFFSGTAHSNAPVQGDTMAVSSPWDLHEHWATTREHHVPPASDLMQANQTFSNSGDGTLVGSLPKVEEEWPAGVILDQGKILMILLMIVLVVKVYSLTYIVKSQTTLRLGQSLGRYRSSCQIYRKPPVQSQRSTTCDACQCPPTLVGCSTWTISIQTIKGNLFNCSLGICPRLGHLWIISPASICPRPIHKPCLQVIVRRMLPSTAFNSNSRSSCMYNKCLTRIEANYKRTPSFLNHTTLDIYT